MPNLPHSIELHDSTISCVENREGSILITFNPAYVHLDGRGWEQVAELRVNEASLDGASIDYPETVMDGRLVTEDDLYHGLLLLPLSTNGAVDLEIEFISGKAIRIRGRGLAVTLKEPRTFLEDVAGRL